MTYNKSKGSGSGGGGGKSAKNPTQTMMKDALKAYNEGGTAGLRTYLGSIPDEYDISRVTDYVAENGEKWVSDYDTYSGWEISDDPIEVKETVIPPEFDETYNKYNELQKTQNFNLEKYKNTRGVFEKQQKHIASE